MYADRLKLLILYNFFPLDTAFNSLNSAWMLSWLGCVCTNGSWIQIRSSNYIWQIVCCRRGRLSCSWWGTLPDDLQQEADTAKTLDVLTWLRQGVWTHLTWPCPLMWPHPMRPRPLSSKWQARTTGPWDRLLLAPAEASPGVRACSFALWHDSPRHDASSPLETRAVVRMIKATAACLSLDWGAACGTRFRG